MTRTVFAPVVRDESRMQWSATCPDCKRIIWLVTDEAVMHGPRRANGSSLLIPASMSAHHECESPE